MSKKVLFACVANSCRSQMAEALARFHGQGKIEAYSAGSNPSGQVNPLAIEVMEERGLDISHHRSKGFNELPADKFDIVVLMGCGEQCPFVPTRKRIEWEILDPEGKPLPFFRKLQDEIESKVISLLQSISNNNL